MVLMMDHKAMILLILSIFVLWWEDIEIWDAMKTVIEI